MDPQLSNRVALRLMVERDPHNGRCKHVEDGDGRRGGWYRATLRRCRRSNFLVDDTQVTELDRELLSDLKER